MPFNCKLDNLLRLLCKHLTQGGFLHTANIIGMMIVNLLIQLLAGYSDLCCVYYDHIITGIDMGGKGGFILSSQNLGNFRCQTAQVFPSASTTYHFLSMLDGLAIKLFMG